MADLTAKRTLVKSPPELWAELGELEALAGHLGEFGEITISRVEPETTVAWEGERARGTVELEASGWGTKVTLTAAVREPDPAPEPPPPGDREPATAPPAAAEPDPEPVGSTPEPSLPRSESPAAARPERRGFLSRIFGRRAAAPAGPATQPAPGLAAIRAERERVSPPPAPPRISAPPRPRPPEPEPAAAAETTAPAPLDPERAQALLEAVLDNLGSAHHRPFSRG